MAAPTENYVDCAAGNDYVGATFTDGAYTQAAKNLNKTNAFTANLAGHKLWLTGTGVTPALFTIATRTDASNVILETDLHPAGDLTDVGCTQHAGAVGTPWATVQGALDLCGRDATNGDRINVKAGTANTLGATLVLTTYGTPTEAAPLIIQGYKTTAGDGVDGDETYYGEIDGGGSYGCFAGTELYVHVRHMIVHNGGSAALIDLASNCSVHSCTIHNTTGNCVNVSIMSNVTGNCIYDGGAVGINASTYCFIEGNYLANSTKTFTTVIYSGGIGCFSKHNIITVGAGTNGIEMRFDAVRCSHNTIFSNGGTGEGIVFSSAVKFNRIVENNYIEGFSGAGGDGIDFDSISENGTIYRNNAFFNNTKPASAGDESGYVAGELLIESGNQYLAATALAKSGANTFANRFVYFAPLAAIQGDAYPSGSNLDIGAVQHADPAGGGGGVTFTRRNTLIGR